MLSSARLALARRAPRPRRTLCAAPVPSSPQPPVTAPPAAAKPEHVITARVGPVKPAAPSMHSTGGGDIGDVLDPHTHDPLKWRKAAWKYFGAVAIFGVFYKALHWYVDGVVAEGKRKREDMEIAKTAVHETASDRAAQREADVKKAAELLEQAKHPLGRAGDAAVAAAAGGGVGSEAADTSEIASAAADEGGAEPFQLFRSVREEPEYVSPEDELKLLEVELEARMKKLAAVRSPSREERDDMRAAEEELFDVRAELRDFAARRGAQAA